MEIFGGKSLQEIIAADIYFLRASSHEGEQTHNFPVSDHTSEDSKFIGLNNAQLLRLCPISLKLLPIVSFFYVSPLWFFNLALSLLDPWAIAVVVDCVL